MVAGGEIRKALPEAPRLKPLEGEQTALPFAGDQPLPGGMLHLGESANGC